MFDFLFSSDFFWIFPFDFFVLTFSLDFFWYFFFFFVFFFSQTVYCWGSILERKELATLTGRAPELCGWASWLGSVAGLCGWALSSSCPPLGSAPELCQLCGWALWLGSVAGPCPPLVLLLAAPLNCLGPMLV